MKKQTYSPPNPEQSGLTRHHVLLILPIVPAHHKKSAHATLLRYLSRLDWDCSIVLEEGVAEWSREGLERVRIYSVNTDGWRRKLVATLSQLRSSQKGRPFSIVRRFLGTLLRPVCFFASFPDLHAASTRAYCEAVDQINARIDVVMSLYHPLSSHTIASVIARRLRIPWVACTKDFYSWPSTINGGPPWWLNQFRRRIEYSILKSSDLVLAVNDNLVDYLREVLPCHPVAVLPHCFDDEDYPDRTVLPRQIEGCDDLSNGPLNLVTVGLVAVTETQWLRVFLNAVHDLASAGTITPADVRIRFVGHGQHLVQPIVDEQGVGEFVSIEGPVPQPVAIERMKSSDVLLFQQAPWGTRRRLPEYLATGKPVLAFPSYPGVMSERVLRKYGPSRICKDRSEMAKAIMAFLEQKRSGKITRDEPDPNMIHQFKASQRAAELRGFLRSILIANASSHDQGMDDASGNSTTGGRLIGIMPTYNRAVIARRSLEILFQQSRIPDELIIVDNGAAKGQGTFSDLWASQPLPLPSGVEMQILSCEENLGSAGGWARGMESLIDRVSDGDWILTMDDDDPPMHSDEIELMARFIDEVNVSSQPIGAVGIVGARFHWGLGQIIRLADSELSGEVDVDYVGNGHVAMYSALAIRRVGFFRSEFFFGHTEVEYGLRLRRSGFRVVANAELWRRRRQDKSTQDLPRVDLNLSRWRRYYVERNFIYLLIRFGRLDLAVLRVLVHACLRPFGRFFSSPRSALLQCRDMLTAARHATLGPMGRTWDPD